MRSSHFLAEVTFKGNTSRFGSAIQLLPTDIGEYLELSFITVVVFISVFHFSLLYSEMTCIIYTSFIVSFSFLNHCRILLSEIKFTTYFPAQLNLYKLLTYILTSSIIYKQNWDVMWNVKHDSKYLGRVALKFVTSGCFHKRHKWIKNFIKEIFISHCVSWYWKEWEERKDTANPQGVNVCSVWWGNKMKLQKMLYIWVLWNKNHRNKGISSNV